MAVVIQQTGGRRTNGLVIKNGNQEGELKLSTNYLSNHAYIWQMVQDPLPNETETVDPEHTWEQVGVTTKATFIIDDLVAGLKYWFRVATVGKEGQSSWSDPLQKTVFE